eukprot:353830-Chlamydomonas_euryale.AAC.1
MDDGVDDDQMADEPHAPLMPEAETQAKAGPDRLKQQPPEQHIGAVRQAESPEADAAQHGAPHAAKLEPVGMKHEGAAPLPSPRPAADEADVDGRMAGGWAEMYGGDDNDDNESEDGDGASPARDGAAPGGGATGGSADLPGDGDLGMPFFFVDAYENTDNRPGEVFLFGKVPSGAVGGGGRGMHGECHQSCCVHLRGLHRSVLFVPRAGAFDDPEGEISNLEAAAATPGLADHDKKAARKALLMHLHVRRGGAHACECA